MVKVPRLISALLVLTLFGAVFSVSLQKTYAAFGDRVTVSGTQFMAGGQRIWFNGANTPWNSWNDFGGSFDATWWGNHFQSLHDNGVNSTRIWITCNGEVGINISADGTVTGATAAHWSNLDTLFQLAQSKGIYIMATLISFDHFKDNHPTYTSWRNMMVSSAKTDSFVNNYVIPFVNRYKSNPYLWSIDLCNEPDWIYEDAAAGNLSWDVLQTYFAKAAVAIHQNSNILVTVGIAMAKYNSDTVSGAQGNKISDAALQAKVNSPAAKVDFYSTHYYDWMGQYWGVPFYNTPAAFGLGTSKPALIGETPANGTTGHTLTQDYESGYTNGWQGAMAWTSNGVDSQGNFSTLVPATNAFRNNHTNLVFPSSTNKALNKTITVSSAESASYTGNYAVDGNMGTRWSSGFSDPQWIYVNLGSTMSVSQVKLKWEAAYGKSFKIQVSTNASTWTDVYSTTTGAGGTQTINFSAVNANYVRMYGTQRGTAFGYSLYEFEVY
jgi:hypothetical protein